MAAHAKRGPSGAHRWLYCAGSIQAEHGLDDTAGFPAAEGVAFHEWSADCLDLGLEPEDLYGSTMFVPGSWKTDRHGVPFQTPGFNFTMDDEFGRHMRHGLDRVREFCEPFGVELYVETRVDTSRWLGEGQFGTADVIIVDRLNKTIIVFDWKYGRGVPVGAKNNSQLKLYALGAIDFLQKRGENVTEDWTARLIIEQPRHAAGGGESETTVAELLQFGEWARGRAAATEEENAPRTPGAEQCEHCKAKGRCQELADFMFEVVQSKFDEEAAEIDAAQPLPEIHDLSVEHRIAIWRNGPLIEKFLKAVHASLMLDWQHGNKPPGLKMVAGRKGRRTYADPLEELAAEAFLLTCLEPEDVYEPRRVISPATAEKRLGKKVYAATYANFVRQSDGKPALVLDHEDDYRPALETVDEKFSDEEDGDVFD